MRTAMYWVSSVSLVSWEQLFLSMRVGKLMSYLCQDVWVEKVTVKGVLRNRAEGLYWGNEMNTWQLKWQGTIYCPSLWHWFKTNHNGYLPDNGQAAESHPTTVKQKWHSFSKEQFGILHWDINKLLSFDLVIALLGQKSDKSTDAKSFMCEVVYHWVE